MSALTLADVTTFEVDFPRGDMAALDVSTREFFVSRGTPAHDRAALLAMTQEA